MTKWTDTCTYKNTFKECLFPMILLTFLQSPPLIS